MFTAKTSKRLQITQAQLQETSDQTEIQRNLFEFEHLIYNKWCSQYKSDTDSLNSRISKI